VSRFADLAHTSDALSPAERLRAACELSDAAVELVRARFTREHPDESAEAIERRVDAWRTTRPGAEHGDGEGHPVAWPRIKPPSDAPDRR
jgi:hypothetical protein